MRKYLVALSALCLLSPVGQANAQDYKTLLDIPEGATLISLSANERVEIEQDLLIANLRVEKEDADAKKVQDEINAIMTKALEEAKSVKSVKVSTQQYHVYQYDRNPGDSPRRNMVWRGQQGLEIKGKTADELLALVGKLQESGLTISGLSYTVSPELLEETRENLLEDALKKLQSKAERTAKALGKSTVDMLQINVDIGGYYPAPMMARAVAMDSMSAKAEMSAPVAAPGESEVNLTVSANVLLK
jgi:predicted secreted protein